MISASVAKNSVKLYGATANRAFSDLATRPSGYRLQYGQGGRNSNSGLTVAVFGCTGFVGRYLLNELGLTHFFYYFESA